jgi:hypothetical protein
MKFVVKECLSAGFVSFRRGAASLDGVLFGKLLFDFSRNGLERIAAGPDYRKRCRMSEPVRHRRFIA